ncbi:MAG: aspartate aminotransferase family protein [Candidatus Melainabacteria bacterium]|nr:aspartate aminotransferase family protein [Candidatus Melainabacteria bacterium]
MSQYAVLDIAASAAKDWLNECQNDSVAAIDNLQTLRRKLGADFSDTGVAPEVVVRELIEATRGGLLGSASGRFYAWVIGGSLPSALAADWLTSSWEQNAALYACSPAASVIEEIAGEWIKEILDLPRESSFAFTTGCQLAHFTCLAAARASVLDKAGWNINEDGLFGAPAIRVLTSEERHGSVDRAVRYLGLGNKSLQALKTDAGGRILVSDLKRVLNDTAAPTILVLNAADLNIAAFDPFEELIGMAKDAGAWVHIDGAFGLFARASKQKRHLTNGLELADSWATDGHKWLNVPFDCGIAIIKDRVAHRQAMTISASYIEAETDARDQIDWNPEWSRRARGIPVYAALRELGKDGVEDLIDRTSRHCHTIVTEIAKIPGAKMLWEPQLNQGLVRFLDSRSNASEADHDQHTKAMINAINAGGEAFFSGTVWNGMYAMRVSVVNWRTNDADVARTIEAVRKASHELQAGSLAATEQN